MNYLKANSKKELMDALENKNDFDIPEGILDEEFNSIWQKIRTCKKRNKLDEDDKDLSDEKLKETICKNCRKKS